MPYSSPGTPDSSVGSPVSPETGILDTNSSDQDYLEILDQNPDPDLQAKLLQTMAELEQTAIKNVQENIIQTDGCHHHDDGYHQNQYQSHQPVDLPYLSDAAANDLLSAVLNATNEVTEADIVTGNDQVFHQMQNMQ